MKLPDSANTITGGCSCGAVRYRIEIPPLHERPLHPMAPPDEGVRLPQVIACHCNDCRRATSSFLVTSIIDLPASALTVSATSPSSESTIASGRILDVMSEDHDIHRSDAARPPYLPATEVLRATKESTSWVRFFHSANCGPDWSRSFCGRCGSQLCYHLKLKPEYCHDERLPEGCEDMFHIYLGSIDRQFLDKDWLVPDVEVFFKHGTSLGKKVSATAVGLRDVPKMVEFSIDQGVVGDEELAKLRA